MVTFYDPHDKELVVKLSYKEMLEIRVDLKLHQVQSGSIHLVSTRLLDSKT